LIIVGTLLHPRRRPVLKRQVPGFTLVEILLALGIFSLLVAALYSTWVLVTKATIVGKTTAAQMQRERVALHAIEDSLTCIQSHQASINYYLFDVQNGDQPILSFTAYLPDSFPRSGEFEGNTPDGSSYMDYHLRRLTFTLEGGDGGSGKDLVLRQNPVLMDLSTEEQNTPLVLARNVTAFTIECWDTNAMQWDTEWDSTNIIPPLVRVTLAFGGQNSGAAQVITREISFPSTTMPAMVQVPNNNGNYIGGRGVFNQNGGNDNQGQPGIGQPGAPPMGGSP
jgi:prepilin-type N-terminal cleavage/methylation domain-containing protein